MTANQCTPGDRENVSEEQCDELGARNETIGSVDGETAVEVLGDFEESNVSVASEWLDDEPGSVELRVSMLSGEMVIALDPEEAKALSAKISSAAAYAEGGEDDE